MRQMRAFIQYAGNEGLNQPAHALFAHSISIFFYIQSNIDSSNTDGSFTMANSNSFLSPYETLPIAQENKYLGKFSYTLVSRI